MAVFFFVSSSVDFEPENYLEEIQYGATFNTFNWLSTSEKWMNCIEWPQFYVFQWQTTCLQSVVIFFENFFLSFDNFRLYIKKFMTWVDFLFAYFIPSFDCDHCFFCQPMRSVFPKFVSCVKDFKWNIFFSSIFFLPRENINEQTFVQIFTI